MPPRAAAAKGKPKPPRPTVQLRLTDVRLALNDVVYNTSKWNACSLPLLGTILLGLSIALIVIGAVKNIEDLIIIGSIFFLGSLIFFFLLYINVCRPLCKRNQVTTYEHKLVDKGDPIRTQDPLPDYGSYSDHEDLLQAKKRPAPTESQLYGNHRSRSFLATPATTTDVQFDEEMGTPPPPRVKSPRSRVASPPPKISVPNTPSRKKSPATYDISVDERLQQSYLDEKRNLELL